MKRGSQISNAVNRHRIHCGLLLAGVAIAVLNKSLHRARRRADNASSRLRGYRVPVVIGATSFEDDASQGVSHLPARADSRLAESVAVRLEAIVESSTDAVFSQDLNGVVTSWNAAAEKIFGYMAHELVGGTFLRLLPFERESEEEQIISRVSRGERVEHFETQRVRKNGDMIDVSVNASPIKDSRGRVIGICRVVRDITESKRAAHALQQSEAQLHTIIENISEAVVVADLDGQLLHFNHAALNIMGYASVDEGRRRLSELADTFEFSSTDGVPWSVDQWPLARILRGETLHNLEARMRRIGAEWERVYSFGGTLAHDVAGKPLMAIVTFREITERQKAETAAVLLAAIVRSSSDAIIGKDLNSLVTSWNAAAEEIFGYSADEMLGRSIAIVIPPERLEDELKIQSKVKDGERVEPFETERIRKNGERIIVLVTVSPIRDASGRVIGSSKAVRDITAMKKASGVIRQLNADLEQRVAERTAQLLTANRELEAFSYSVSHDLRAPLRSIDGFSKAILEDYGEKLDDTGKDHLHRVRAASQRMGQLIDDLLNLSRVSRGELRQEATDFSQIAREAFEECRSNAEGRHVTIKIADNLICEADPRLMRIVLTNLISNAWKFTGNNPNATIELGCNVFEGQKEYFVHDNGAGFDMTYVDKLFGAFQRLHSDKEFPGTGIGLATIKRIIQRHGGTVRAQSNPGEGTTFYFTLHDQPNSQTSVSKSAA